MGRHGEHDHVDLVAVFDAFPEVDVRSVSFYHVVATFLQVADASCVVLHAKDPHTVDLSQLGVAGDAEAANAQDECVGVAKLDGAIPRMDFVRRACG